MENLAPDSQIVSRSTQRTFSVHWDAEHLRKPAGESMIMALIELGEI